MIHKKVIRSMSSNTLEEDIDGIHYIFKLINYDEAGGYASLIIKDCSTGESYYSPGYIELNGHIFESKWCSEYSYNRDNYINTTDLMITID